jgi:hypothetical protein
LVVDPVKIAALGTFISAATLILNLYFRRRDSRSRLNIDYRVGNDVPHAWWTLSRTTRTSEQEQLLWFSVENVGARTEFFSDVYIAVPGGGDVRPFSGGNPSAQSALQPRFPIVFNQSLQGVSHALVNEGCKGTAKVELVVELGRGKRHKKRIEIPDVEGKASKR